MLNIVRHHLKQNLIRSLTISGEVKISDRQAVVQAFNSEEKKYMVKCIDIFNFKDFYCWFLGFIIIIESGW